MILYVVSYGGTWKGETSRDAGALVVGWEAGGGVGEGSEVAVVLDDCTLSAGETLMG